MKRLILVACILLAVGCQHPQPPRPTPPQPPTQPPPTEPVPPVPSPQPPRPWVALRGDFLTSGGLSTGEYPMLSVPKRKEVRDYTVAQGYTLLQCETNWGGSADVPAYDLLEKPTVWLARAAELEDVGVELIPQIGLEGIGQADLRYVERARRFVRDVKPKHVVIGIESDEWSTYDVYKALVKAVAQPGVAVYTHFTSGRLGHSGAKDIPTFWKENPRLRGLLYQYVKSSRAGRFLVPDSDLLAQTTHVRALLPASIELHAGEYANLVAAGLAQRAGTLAVATGLVNGVWNGVGKAPAAPQVWAPPAVRDAIDIKTVTFLNNAGRDISKEIRSWPIQVDLKVTWGDGGKTVTYSGVSGQWPLTLSGVQSNGWECGSKRGKVTCQTWDYFRPYVDSKEWLGWGIASDGPRYMMASRTARVSYDNGKGRSQLVRIR